MGCRNEFPSPNGRGVKASRHFSSLRHCLRCSKRSIQCLVDRADFDDLDPRWIGFTLAQCFWHNGCFESQFLRLPQTRLHLAWHAQFACKTDLTN